MLCALYARGGMGWVLGFVALVPWLRSLDGERSLAGALLNAWAMSVTFTAAVFSWFGLAIGAYTELGDVAGIALLLAAAPVFQPQFLALALARHLIGHPARRAGLHEAGNSLPPSHGAVEGARSVGIAAALAGAAAWVAAEALLPRLLGDSLGHGLYPARLLRQAADLGGAAGLTLLLLFGNLALAAAWARRARGWRAVWPPLLLAAAIPGLLAAYGHLALSRLQAAPAAAALPLRMGLVQSNLHDYERLRREKGAAAVVREVLDTHYAMSYDAVERQHVDAVLWSETVYPTTFGHPKSEAGAELDAEILSIVNAAGVPFVFGTYDRDDAGEYNGAAFVSPDSGLLGIYRKTHLFPLTEGVPAWLEGPTLRRWLPWAGTWRPGTGARVFPLRLADGREIPVLPLICLDDVDPDLSLDGARLGALVLLTLSNDAWFTARSNGAALHQAVAAFRSIETRLPQFRVSTTGYSAAIDATGSVTASTPLGAPALLVGELPVVSEPRPTLMLAWGDWVGRAAAVVLALWVAVAATERTGRAWRAWRGASVDPPAGDGPLPNEIFLLPAAARWAAGLLRAVSRGALLWMLADILFGDGMLQARPLALIRSFLALSVIPEAAAWCVLRAFSARIAIADGALVFTRRRQRTALALEDIVAVEPWPLPWPQPGAWLRLRDGARWRFALAGIDAWALARAIVAARATPLQPPRSSRGLSYAQARLAVRRGRLTTWPIKFLVLPLLLAMPAFRLHQHIAYGSALGEYFSFGPLAFLTSFALWWAAWIIGVVLCAAALRTLVEVATVVIVLLAPARAGVVRAWLERGSLLALYAGLPVWLVLRLLVG